MQEALRIAVAEARSAGANRILGMRLRIGALRGVVPDAMRFAFGIVCRGTIADGARFEIETVEGLCRCLECGIEFPCTDFFYECPSCHQLSGELRRGQELEIVALDLN